MKAGIMKNGLVTLAIGSVCLLGTANVLEAKNIFKSLLKVYTTYQEVNMMLWLSGDIKAERRFGEEAKWFINLTNKKVKDPQTKNWVQAVFNRVKPHFRDRGMDYNITIIKDDSVNAFAIPGGNIFINSGMLKFVTSDDELAAVIAHELAHAERRHSLKQLRQNAAFQVLLQKAVKKGRDRDTWGQIVGALTMLQFSRQDEDEADDLGQIRMTQAGFNPVGQVTLWEKFVHKFGKGEKGILQYLSTHPPSQTRVENARKNLTKLAPGVTEKSLVASIQPLSFNVFADVEENLVQNGSFETDVAKKGFADAWTVKEGNAALNTEHALSGRQSLMITNENTMKQTRVISEFIPVSLAEKYVLKGWVHSADGKQRVSIGAEVYDKAKRIRGFIWPVLSGATVSKQWTSFEGVFEAGTVPNKSLSADAAFIRIVLQGGPLSRGAVWFDDLRLQRAAYKPPQNLIAFGSFEYDDGSGKPQGISGTPGALSRDVTKAKMGYASLKMTGSGKPVEMEFAPISIADIKPGHQLNCSFYFMGNQEIKGKIELIMMDESGNPLPRKFGEREFSAKPDLWQASGIKCEFNPSAEEQKALKNLGIKVRATMPDQAGLWLDGFIMR